MDKKYFWSDTKEVKRKEVHDFFYFDGTEDSIWTIVNFLCSPPAEWRYDTRENQMKYIYKHFVEIEETNWIPNYRSKILSSDYIEISFKQTDEKKKFYKFLISIGKDENRINEWVYIEEGNYLNVWKDVFTGKWYIEILKSIEDYKEIPYKDKDILPKSFGDYLVVIDEKGSGRRVAFRQFIPHSDLPDLFGDGKQEGWILGENETLVYWMEIPNWC